MDQVRVFLRIVWKERFWVLTFLVTLVACLSWMSAAGQLDSEFAKRKSEINKQFTAMSKLRSEQVHPNDRVNDKDLEQAQQQREFVLKVWQDLYDRQRQEVLFWPKVLGKDFIDYIEDKQFLDKLSSQRRNTYWNYIRNRFDGLLEIVDALKVESKRGNEMGGGGGYGEFRGGGGIPGMAGPGMGGQQYTVDLDKVNQDYLVQWVDQGKLRAQLDFEKLPTATEVWVTQEDLWVYESLLKIIAATNKERGATRPDNTAIRVIVALEVGGPASMGSRSKGNVLLPGAGAGAGGMGGREMGDMEMGGMDGGEFGGGYPGMGMGDEYGMGGMGDDTQADTKLLAMRYLDESGEPYPGESESFGREFRQLPVRMVLLMEQRWIPQVLIECANAALPVEVQHLRVNADKSGAGFSTGRGGGMGGGGMGAGGMAGYGGGNMTRNLAGTNTDNSLSTVEIRGIVYIYNEPDQESLSLPGDEEEADDQSLDAA